MAKTVRIMQGTDQDVGRRLFPAALVAVVAVLFFEALRPDAVFAYRDSLHFYPPLYKLVREEWLAGRVPLWNPLLNGGRQTATKPGAHLWIGLLQLGEGCLHGGGPMECLKRRPREALEGCQGGQNLRPAIGQVVVGVEDARRQLDQLPLVAEEQQAPHARLGRRHQHRADPVAGL